MISTFYLSALIANPFEKLMKSSIIVAEVSVQKTKKSQL
jgi:hypothetical protein